MNELSMWVQCTQAAALIALAFSGAAIAYRQWHAANNKLRLGLFDRRFEVYAGTLDFIGAVMREGYPTSEHHGPFLRLRDRAQYLFGPEVNNLLARINKTAAVLRVNAMCGT